MGKNSKRKSRGETAAGQGRAEGAANADSAEQWHQRQQQGRHGAYGSYGGSEDQWADDRSWPGVRPGSVPHVPRGGGASRAYRARFDVEPYRDTRIYGHEAGEYVSRTGLGGGGMEAQFGGRDDAGAYAPRVGHGGWSRGPRVLPKGYERSDERIREDVCEHLSRARELDISDVSVQVKEGVVTLEGTVPVRGMKHAIEDIADDCVGVSDVDNRIRVRRVSGTRIEGGLAWAEDDGVLLNGRQR